MCLHPIKASLNPEGGRPLLTPEGELQLGCGKCAECISKRASEWAMRAKHEISLHQENCFLTLTYDDENLESQYIVHEDFQKFLKRLRKKVGKISYMVSQEYGSKTNRPHFHAIIFGWTPPNQEYLKHTPSGYPLYRSESVSKLWDKGYHSIGEANAQTAYYIASYALKGNEAVIIDEVTGEEVEIRDKMLVSKKPGIGLKYLEQNAEQLVDSRQNLPRYYQKKLEEKFPDLHEQYQNDAQERLKTRSSHEIFARHCILHQKTALHSTSFRADYEYSKKDNRKLKEIEFRKLQLERSRDEFANTTQGKKLNKGIIL
jgi:hypothetical protein